LRAVHLPPAPRGERELTVLSALPFPPDGLVQALVDRHRTVTRVRLRGADNPAARPRAVHDDALWAHVLPRQRHEFAAPEAGEDGGHEQRAVYLRGVLQELLNLVRLHDLTPGRGALHGFDVPHGVEVQ